MPELLILFFEFFKTGLFAIGGGMAALPFMYAMADKYTWVTREAVTDMIAISESTPGPFGINTATYVGYSAFGIAGAVTATVALALPSLTIVLIIARFLDKFGENKFVKSAFYGIRPAVAALIALAGLEVFKASVTDYRVPVLSAAVLILSLRLKWHPIAFIAASAVIGIVFKL